MSNYTYILKCADGTFYCGWTNNLEKRLTAHNDGTAAKYTRTRRPVELVYYEEFETKPKELPDLEQVILIYCRSGRRSKEASQKLADIGYKNIYEFGGINNWTGEIINVEK